MSDYLPETLRFLPRDQLDKAQGVCRKWKALIERDNFRLPLRLLQKVSIQKLQRYDGNAKTIVLIVTFEREEGVSWSVDIEPENNMAEYRRALPEAFFRARNAYVDFFILRALPFNDVDLVRVRRNMGPNTSKVGQFITPLVSQLDGPRISPDALGTFVASFELGTPVHPSYTFYKRRENAKNAWPDDWDESRATVACISNIPHLTGLAKIRRFDQLEIIVAKEQFKRGTEWSRGRDNEQRTNDEIVAEWSQALLYFLFGNPRRYDCCSLEINATFPSNFVEQCINRFLSLESATILPETTTMLTSGVYTTPATVPGGDAVLEGAPKKLTGSTPFAKALRSHAGYVATNVNADGARLVMLIHDRQCCLLEQHTSQGLKGDRKANLFVVHTEFERVNF